MPHSMTGFASVAVEAHSYQISWELRSVNHRFLDVSLRLPEEHRRLEGEFRRVVAEHVKRGKVDCTLRIAPVESGPVTGRVDPRAADAVGALQNDILARFPDAAPLSVAELLRWPGIVSEPERPVDALADAAAAALEDAASALAVARLGEGQRIAALLERRAAVIIEIVAALRPLIADLPEKHAAKLRERIERLGVNAEPGRLEQELAIVAQRLDMDEELDRLESHVGEIRATLELDEPIGRKLDFVIQELNREANTLSSKAPDDAVTRLAVELKVLIEQMREQVQNLE